MLRPILVFVGIAMASVTCLPAAGQEPSIPGASPASSQRALLNKYCVTCHNEKLKTAGLMLDKVDVEKVPENADVWEKVIRKVRTSAMPPAGMPRPDQAGYDSLATYLETALDRAAAASPNPGRPGIHRLNRAEYTNSIHELLDLEIDGRALLPADDAGYGFDNIGDVLSVSPLLLDRYLSAARQISRLAIGDPTIRVPVTTYNISQRSWQDDQASEDLPFWSRGGIAIRHSFPLDAEYLLTIRLSKAIGGDSPHELDVRLDGVRLKQFTIGGRPGVADSQKDSMPAGAENGLEVRFTAKAGTHLVGVAFMSENSLPEGMLKPPLVTLEQGGSPTGDPNVASVAISGPQNVKGVGDSPSRRKIFVCTPAGAKDGAPGKDEEACAKQILSGLARHAYRRPVNSKDAEALLRLYRDGRKDRDFNAAIGMTLEGLLVSPEFLFRIESEPPNVAPGTVYRVSDLDLASRLSFFLWSSPPDEQLLGLAERGKLKDGAILEQQVSRMLADSRSKALVDNFTGQWLGLRSVPDALPDPNIFPEFDENLREAFEKETDLFLESMLREDHSVLELLSANYTFVNERLARHYGIPDVYGSRFRRVTLTDEARVGLLGKGSLLTITALPNRTSPVLRGKWVLENILGTPPPPPPPNVPPLAENKDTARMTMRQRMEQHRANPVCASCHARMDPIGFAMENFDAVGKWRTAEGEGFTYTPNTEPVHGTPIDPSGALPDGTKFRGAAELQKILLSRPRLFVTTVTEKLLTYALGRGVEYYDEPVIRSILRDAAPNNYRWSALILGIVKSAPFHMQVAPEQKQGSPGQKVAAAR